MPARLKTWAGSQGPQLPRQRMEGKIVNTTCSKQDEDDEATKCKRKQARGFVKGNVQRQREIAEAEAALKACAVSVK